MTIFLLYLFVNGTNRILANCEMLPKELQIGAWSGRHDSPAGIALDGANGR